MYLDGVEVKYKSRHEGAHDCRTRAELRLEAVARSRLSLELWILVRSRDFSFEESRRMMVRVIAGVY